MIIVLCFGIFVVGFMLGTHLTIHGMARVFGQKLSTLPPDVLGQVMRALEGRR